MTDITFLSPRKDQAILTTHIEVLERASRETGVVDGNALAASSPADMDVSVDAGRIKISGEPIDVDADSITISAAHETLPRIDILYRDPSGDIQVTEGTPAVIEDTKGLGDWKSYTSPVPAADIPAGAILGAVYVGAAATSITNPNIWMFAGGVGDMATVVGDPGVDTRPASEKAVRDAIVAGNFAPASEGVTGGDSHDHSGGDGAQIDHTTLSNKGTNTHSAIDTFIGSKAAASGLASLDAGGRVVQSSKLHASDHASGGSDSIKLDDLASPDDNTDLDASTSAHGLMPKFPNTKTWLRGDKTWQPNSWGYEVKFGDGSSVISAQSDTSRAGIKACTLTKVVIRSTDGAAPPALVADTLTVSLYVHDYNAEEGSAVDTFSLSSASSYLEGSLSHSIAADKWITISVSGASASKCLVVSLEFEAV